MQACIKSGSVDYVAGHDPLSCCCQASWTIAQRPHAPSRESVEPKKLLLLENLEPQEAAMQL